MTDTEATPDKGLLVKATHPDDESRVEQVRLFGHTRDTIEDGVRRWLAEGRNDPRWNHAATEIVDEGEPDSTPEAGSGEPGQEPPPPPAM